MHVFFAAYFIASFQVSDFPLILGHKMSLVYPLAAVFRFAILQEGAPKKICYHGFIGTIIKYLRNQKLTQGRQWSIKISRIFPGKKHLPLHVCKLQFSTWILVPRQSLPLYFGAGLVHVRVRVLCPASQVGLHGFHGDH